jgi:hypothetical protein
VPGGWVKGDPEGPLPLYGLDWLAQSTGGVLVVEGEGKASALWRLGFSATTSAHGALSAKKTDWSPLAGRSVAILPDHNEVGGKYADGIISLCRSLSPPPTIRVVTLPEIWRTDAPIPDGGDVKDWLEVGVPKEWDAKRQHDELTAVIKSARVFDLVGEIEPEPEPVPAPVPVPVPEPVVMPDWDPGTLSPGRHRAPDVKYSPEQLAAIAAMQEALRNRTRSPRRPSIPTGPKMTPLERAKLWLKKREPAKEDGTGDRFTFETILAVMKTFGLDENQLMEAMADWNQTCEPPWKEKDLRAKVRSTIKLYGK